MKWEDHLSSQRGPGPLRTLSHLPPHYILKGGVGHTVRNLYLHRHHEPTMRDIYYLAGLIDCMINQVNPVLRTPSIQELYSKVTTLQTLLSVKWQGPLDHVLCPIDRHLFNDLRYRQAISRAKTMKDLYREIREGTGRMFDILSHEYVFYTPGMVHE
ncbi:MAG: hypothetical protein JRJ29_08085 [Deltaproteobacteria bacterium]|nr:hypothetical protein [Deltaproteobacteria bacterium]